MQNSKDLTWHNISSKAGEERILSAWAKYTDSWKPQSNGKIIIRCPDAASKHHRGDHDPSGVIFPSNTYQRGQCSGCDGKWTLLDLIMDREGLTFKEAAAFLIGGDIESLPTNKIPSKTEPKTDPTATLKTAEFIWKISKPITDPKVFPYLSKLKSVDGFIKFKAAYKSYRATFVSWVYDKDSFKKKGLQFISVNPGPKGRHSKTFQGGVCGVFLLTGDHLKHKKHVYLCEGMRTGLALFEAFQCSVMVCYIKTNLTAGVKLIQGRQPDKSIIIAADNDRNDDGIKAAREAKEAAGDDRTNIIMPVETGKDFYDLLEGGQISRPAYQYKC